MLQIGRYQILDELGRGAMGVVYKAQDPAIGRIIAIKSIRLNDLTDEKERLRLRDRLYREAQSAGILSHPGIVTIYDYAEENGLAYIFMEFVNGPPLEHVLSSSVSPGRTVLLGYLQQTAAALDYAHRKGIVHRDIKPSNIMIHENTTAKITDFGIAKIASQHLTQAGAIMGTPSYMSPEQVEGNSVDGRADQYSLAVLAYEILTGEKPFSSDALPTLLLKIVRDEPPPPTSINVTLSGQVDVVFRRALAKTAEQRYSTCQDFIADLTEALHGTPEWTPMVRGASQHTTTGSDATADSGNPPSISQFIPPNYVPHVRPQKSSLLRNVLLATGTAVGLLGVGAFFLYQQRIQPFASAPAEAAVAQPEPGKQDPPRVEPPPPDAVEPPPPVKANDPSVPAVAVANKPPTAPQEGTFVLTATPAGATAVFDQDAATECKTPCNVTLPMGRHTVTIQAEGYRVANRFFNTPQDSGQIVNLEKAQGILILATDPTGLPVFIDGKEQARKTTATFYLPTGPHKVELVNGTERRELSIEIRDGVTTAQTVKW